MSMLINTPELNHLVTRSFGDELLLQSLERKCMCVAQLKSHSPVLRMSMVRKISMPEAGYVANPMLVKLIWSQTIDIVKQPFQANIEAAVLRAPSIELKPSEYQRS
jgi:hypothetical protein